MNTVHPGQCKVKDKTDQDASLDSAKSHFDHRIPLYLWKLQYLYFKMII